MDGSHYFLKSLRLESYIDQDPLPRVDLDNFELGSKIKAEEHSEGGGSTIKDGLCDKQNLVGDEVGQITGGVQADDFFSSLELQSSSKTSSNVLSLSFSNKLTGGIVTRSRSFSSALHETSKARGKVISRLEPKEPTRRNIKKRKEILCPKTKTKQKGKARKQQDKQMSSNGKDKILAATDFKKQFSNKCAENAMEKTFGVERSRDEDDWILFNNLSCKKDQDENKHILANDLQNPVRRGTPELFSMNSILMSDGLSEGKDEVDNLLGVEDYDDSFLEEMDEFNYAPPRSHTGGKWKPGTLTVRTSPILWQCQNWDSYLDDRQHDYDRRNRAETPTECASDRLNRFSMAPIGGKPKSLVLPSSYTGGKWKPSDHAHRSKKLDQESLSPVDSDTSWKYESDRTTEPPPTHTGGKWKPSSIHAADLWRVATTPKLDLELPSSDQVTGKWGSESPRNVVNRSTLDVLAKCQSTSGKCLKTSGGMIQYYCSPCNRRLSSKKMYNKHIQSELHFKRVLQENELEFDSRSLKLFHGLFTQAGCKERGLGKREIKKPEVYKDSETRNLRRDKKVSTLANIKGKRLTRREIIRCEICRVRVPSHQLGKHLVSYCHSRRIQLSDPEQQKLILDNIHAIVKQAPYQCGMCKFYCNTHTSFKRHWSLAVHKEMEKSKNQRFWCALCSFECETSRSMELHLDSNSHREVILAVNRSIPIIIRHKVVFRCTICLKEFRFNREFIHHNKVFHRKSIANKSDKFVCPVCGHNCKSIKSLQSHILNSHKGDAKVPYFCSTCSEFFNTAAEAKIHRNGQFHKYKKTMSGRGKPKLRLSRPCTYCGETLENIQKLKSHLLQDHSELLPKCTKCGMTFALSQEVSQHVKNKDCDFGQKKTGYSHSEVFSCESCPFATSTKSELLLHSALHQKNSNEGKKISCPLCGTLFTQTCLGIHLRTHLKERTYQCSTCTKAFVRKDRYAKHVRLRHGSKESFQLPNFSNKEEAEEERERREDRKSEEGDVKATDLEMLGLEKKEKSAERRQTCGDAKCRYVPKDSKDWENHRKFHVGPKNFQCPECPYSAKTNTIMKRHYMIHVDERSSSCHLCPFKARLKSHLKRHMRLHTGAKPYKCPHCPYTCNILENLRKHVLFTKIHPGKKLYECKFCSFSTNVSKEFKVHLFKIHQDECSFAESNEVAGIYNREDDLTKPTCSVPVRSRLTAAQTPKNTNITRSDPRKLAFGPDFTPTSRKKVKLKPGRGRVYSPGLKKKVYLLTQKFSPIAPKPQCAKQEITSSILNTRNPRNSVEDKRKILKMELEKLKHQIKPGGKGLPKSYPISSTAEKDSKTITNDHKNDAVAAPRGKQSSPARKFLKEGGLPSCDASDRAVNLEGELFLVNLTPAAISGAEEPPPKVARCGGVLQQTDLSSVCILYESGLPAEEIELYPLKDYQV